MHCMHMNFSDDHTCWGSFLDRPSEMSHWCTNTQAANPVRGGATEEPATGDGSSRGRFAGPGVEERRLPCQRRPTAICAHALLLRHANVSAVSHLHLKGLPRPC